MTPGGLGSPAPSTAAPSTPAWDTVPPMVTGNPPPAPPAQESDRVTVVQPAPPPVQSAPPTPVDSALPGPSAARTKPDSALPSSTPGLTSLPAEMAAEPKTYSEGGNGASPPPAVPPTMNAGNPQTPDNPATRGQEGEAETPRPGRVRANPPPSTPGTPAHRVRWRHVYGPRPATRPLQPQPTFWQRLFGQKQTKNAKPGKLRH